MSRHVVEQTASPGPGRHWDTGSGMSGTAQRDPGTSRNDVRTRGIERRDRGREARGEGAMSEEVR